MKVVAITVVFGAMFLVSCKKTTQSTYAIKANGEISRGQTHVVKNVPAELILLILDN